MREDDTIIREIKFCDWRKLAQLARETFPELSRDKIASMLQDRSNILVLETHGKAIGFCTLRGHTEKTCWLDYLAIDPDYRNQGLGKLLLDAIERISRYYGYDKVKLAVLSDNTNAKMLYEKTGYIYTNNRRQGYI